MYPLESVILTCIINRFGVMVFLLESIFFFPTYNIVQFIEKYKVETKFLASIIYYVVGVGDSSFIYIYIYESDLASN